MPSPDEWKSIVRTALEEISDSDTDDDTSSESEGARTDNIEADDTDSDCDTSSSTTETATPKQTCSNDARIKRTDSGKAPAQLSIAQTENRTGLEDCDEPKIGLISGCGSTSQNENKFCSSSRSDAPCVATSKTGSIETGQKKKLEQKSKTKCKNQQFSGSQDSRLTGCISSVEATDDINLRTRVPQDLIDRIVKERIQLCHFIGGPCYPTRSTALCLVRHMGIAEINSKFEHVQTILEWKSGDGCATESGCLVNGCLSELYVVAVHEALASEGSQACIPIHIYWGDARWSRTQLLGELARGSWGMCKAEGMDAICTQSIVDEHTNCVSPTSLWKHLLESKRLIYAPKVNLQLIHIFSPYAQLFPGPGRNDSRVRRRRRATDSPRNH